MPFLKLLCRSDTAIATAKDLVAYERYIGSQYPDSGVSQYYIWKQKYSFKLSEH